MQHVNDDMDEVFRQAAEEYPLDTSGADWNNIAQKLAADKKEPSVSNKRQFLWLLLLIPFSFICNQYFVDSDINIASNKKPGEHTNAQQAENSNKVNRDERVKNDFIKNNVKNQNLRDRNSLTPQDNSSNPVNRNIRLSALSSDQKTLPVLKSTKTVQKFDDETVTNAIAYNLIDFKKNQYPSITIHEGAAVHETISKPQKRLVEYKPSKLYAGILGGVDATTIKFQKIENASYDIGGVVGYDLNDRWSIESGLFLVKKFYYTDGEYYNTSKLYLPPNSSITAVSGNCRMWEIPLSVRYHFGQKKTHGWFVSGGVSSYIMKNEDYVYTYYYASSGQSADHPKSYSNSSKHLFAIAQFSAGYTHTVKNIGDLRIEPYTKLPLKGVGMGSIPLQSAGVHIGITRPIF